jgi:D-beta-D-heptose 7-phosphate kinase/D-beta-D-heptose 1-phosphate adenosyltransferase
MKKKAIIVSGYFNPIHKGYLEYFNNAKPLTDELFVLVNSNFQRGLKGSKEFQNEEERLFIVQKIKAVDKAFLSTNKDRTVCEYIKFLVATYGKEYTLGFVKRGNQENTSISEAPICNQLGVNLIYGLGDKIQSSSWLLKSK